MLGPLAAPAVEAIAREYGADPPVGRLLEESAGVPARVHRAARRWAREETARRLGASADRAAGERARLRVAEDDLAAGVVELQAARERPALDTVACPFKGLASFDVDDAEVFFGRERLVAEMVARLAGAAVLGIVGPSGSGKSSALRAGLLPALADGVLPGSRSWAIALLRPGRAPAARARAGGRAGRARRAAGDRRRPVRGGVHRLPRRARAGRVRRRARRRRARPAPPRGRADRAARRLLRALRELPGAVADAGRQPRAGRPDAPRRAAARDRVARAARRSAGRRGARRRAGRRRPGSARGAAAALDRAARAVGAARRPPAHASPPTTARAASTARSRGWPSGSTSGLDPQQQAGAQAILVRLAGVGEGDAVVRRRVPLAELERTPGAAEVLAALADGRLVIVSREEAEVAHEALLREWPRLRAWLEEDVDGRRLHHHLGVAAREWDTRGATRASSTAARGWPRRSSGRRPTSPSSTRSSGRSSSRAGRRASARNAACGRCSRASACCSCSRSWQGWSRSSSAAPRATGRRGRRPAARLARARRERPRPLAAARPPGRRARRQPADARQPARRAEQEPGRHRRHARGRGGHVGARVEPGRAHARRRRSRRQRLPVRHADAATDHGARRAAR